MDPQPWKAGQLVGAIPEEGMEPAELLRYVEIVLLRPGFDWGHGTVGPEREAWAGCLGDAEKLGHAKRDAAGELPVEA